jgi:hypothetical protein
MKYAKSASQSVKFNVVIRFSPERSRWIRGDVYEAQTETVQDDGSLVRPSRFA